MKKALKLVLLASLFTSLMTNSGCKKSADLPEVITYGVSQVTRTTAESGGIVTLNGQAKINEKGICWSIMQNPTISDPRTNDGTGSGTFTSKMTGLIPDTRYYLRAFAMTSSGTAYGNEISFISDKVVTPTVNTIGFTSITDTSATAGCDIISDGGGKVNEWGVSWSTMENPTLNDERFSSSSSEGGSGIYTFNIEGLTPGTIYYVRAYAINNAGVAYGEDLTFTTLAK